jgi:transcriptional regulator of acetoin/glycerol metabolism
MAALLTPSAPEASSMTVAHREYGLVAPLTRPSQLILESHARCQYLGLKMQDACDYSTQTVADFRITLERNARLIAQATSVVEMLGNRVGDFGSMLVLTDGTGTILRTRCQSTFIEHAEKVALRPGVSWAESSKGTNAVGTALILGSGVYVHGEEHYIQSNHFLSCAASPIMDHAENLIGVLDVSGDRRSFHPHTMVLVDMCARTIENNWFRDKFRQSMQLHFHTAADLIGTAEEGVIAFDEDGKVLGANRNGLKIIGTSAAFLRIQGLRTLFGQPFGELMDKLRLATFTPMKISLANGASVFVRVSWGESAMTVSATLPSFKPTQSQQAPAQAVQNTALNAKRAVYQLEDLDFGDAHVRSVIQKVRQVIDKDIPILILGETGTGKELLANAIHHYSQRRDAPFVAINCASIPETLIESELFGYEEGAFTGAKRKGAPGKLLQANGGTLFLDEIGDMPLSLQARLLRVLQERKVVPLGGHRAVDIDVTLISATHRNLRERIDQREFRGDLYYRINGMSVRLPSLRDRTDLAALSQKILRELSPQRRLSLQPALMEAFLRYPWPGNLRQLTSVLKTAAIMASEGHEITSAHLSDDFLEEISAPYASPEPQREAVQPVSMPAPVMAPRETLPAADRWSTIEASPPAAASQDNLEQVEFMTIRRTLEACEGNVSKAAKILNISRNTIYRKLKKPD